MHVYPLDANTQVFYLMGRKSRHKKERRVARAQLTNWVANAPGDIKARIRRIKAELASHSTLNLLAQFTGIIKFADPETYKEYEDEHIGVELEYATWLVLQMPSPVAPSNTIPDWIDTNDLEEIVYDIRDLVRDVIRFHTMSDGRNSGLLERLARKSMIDNLVVRYRGYEQHLVELLRALFRPFQSQMTDTHRFTVDEAIAISRRLNEHVNLELYKIRHLQKEQYSSLSRALWSGDRKALLGLGLSDNTIEEVLVQPLRKREEWGRTYSVLKAWNSFQSAMVVDKTSIEPRAGVSHDSATGFLDTFSLSFGQEIIADNWPSRYEPLYMAPLIRLGAGSYFAHLAITDLLWAIRPNLEHRFKDSGHWQRYEKHRSNVVETEALRLLASILAGSRSFPNLKYRMPDIHGTLRQYELDGMILYDKVLVLVEARAGTVSPAARRGAPSLKEDLKELLGKGHDQVNRAKMYLESDEEVEFLTRDGGTLELRISDFSRVIGVVVTLDSIAAFASEWEGLFESQTTASNFYRWSVELLDLFVIAEIVEYGPQFIHYIDCLSRLPDDILEFNDVLDTFGSYLKCGLNFSTDLHQVPKKIGLLSYTTEFDDYFNYKAGKRQTPASKPTMALNPNDRRSLRDLCDSAPPGFVERAFEILDAWRDSAAGNYYVGSLKGPRRN